MKKNIIIASLCFLSLLSFFMIGRISKHCEDCKECEIQIRYIEKKVQIQKLEDEIKNITINLNRKYRDSIRAILNPK